MTEATEKNKEFMELRADLLTRLILCGIKDGKVYVYEETLDAALRFINFFTTGGEK